VLVPLPVAGKPPTRSVPRVMPVEPSPAPARKPDEAELEEPATERERLVEAMEKAGWVQAKAARILGLTPRQIGYALKKHGIEIRHF
jgi:Nif-specific regulatory protein